MARGLQRQGKVWQGNHKEFYQAQKATAQNTEVKENPQIQARAVKALAWKANALRHSFASYRFAEIGDAGRVAGALGNSAAVVHRHYRELVKKAAAEKWFGIKPDRAQNIVSLPLAVISKNVRCSPVRRRLSFSPLALTVCA